MKKNVRVVKCINKQKKKYRNNNVDVSDLIFFNLKRCDCSLVLV